MVKHTAAYAARDEKRREKQTQSVRNIEQVQPELQFASSDPFAAQPLCLCGAPWASPSVSDGRVLLEGGAECGDLLGQPLHHRVLQLGLVGAVETVERIRVVHGVDLHTHTHSQCVSM